MVRVGFAALPVHNSSGTTCTPTSPNSLRHAEQTADHRRQDQQREGDQGRSDDEMMVVVRAGFV
jgi:hypothetical protein